MSTTVGEDVTRVTVISPTRRIDLALPSSATLGEILPNIVRFSGYEGGTTSDAVHAWVLQRFGEDPLDPTRLVADLQIRDGETLHLRHREHAMPDAAFDDVVDAVATSTSGQAAWRPVHGQRLALLVLAALISAVALSWTLSVPGLISALVVLVVAVGVGIGAVVLSRAFGKRPLAITFAWLSVGLAALAGFSILDGSVATRALVASAAVLLFAGAMALGAHVHPYAFMGTALAAVVIMLATMVMVLWPENTISAAAVTVIVVLILTPMLPMTCYRLAHVAMPNLPSNADELIADDTPVQGDIVARALIADRLLAGFLLATAISVPLLAIPVIGQGRWWHVAFGFALSLALMLRARAFTGLPQRLSLVISGIVVGGVTLYELSLLMPSAIVAMVVGFIVVVLAAVLLGMYATSMYDQFVSPWWGRWGDIFEWLALLALFPLVLQILDLYWWAYGLAG